MHNMVRTKQQIFKQPCQSFRTNSELLPASAYNCSMRAVLRSSRLTRSAAIFLRLTARDCFFLGAICGREQGECYYVSSVTNGFRLGNRIGSNRISKEGLETEIFGV